MNLKQAFKTTAKWTAAVLGCFVLITVAYFAQFFLLTPEPPTQPTTIETVDDLDRYFASLVEQQLPPALDITVLKGSKTVFSKAYGIVDGVTGEAATSGHVYHYWSITKSFTAVAIFQLIEKDLISLDAPLTNYLPQFVPVNKAGEPVKVTVGHLLSHSSGFPDINFKMLEWIHFIDTPRVGDTHLVNEGLQAFRTSAWEPGSQREYTNTNYILLGAIIEAVTGQTYEDYVRRELLLPLKIQDTDFIYRPDMLEKAATGSHEHYSFFTPMLTLWGPEDGLDGITETRIDDRHWLKPIYTDYAASTALIGTGADLSRFGQMLLNQGELDGVRILSQENAMNVLFGGRLPGQKEEVASGERDMALGYGTKTWVDQGAELIGHGGGGPGFALQYVVVPEKDLVIVVLANSTMNDSFELAKLIASVF